MNLKYVVIGVVSLGLLFAGVALGKWMEKDTLEEITERNNRLAERAQVVEEAYAIYRDQTQKAFSKITFDYLETKTLEEELRERNVQLAEHIADQDAEITSLVQTNSELRARLAGADTVTRTDSTFTVVIDRRKDYERGNISVTGTTVLSRFEPDSAQTDLDVSVSTSPIIVWQRNETGEAKITIDHGDMPITVNAIYGAQNPEDPILGEAREPFWAMFGKISGGVVAIGVLGLSASLLF